MNSAKISHKISHSALHQTGLHSPALRCFVTDPADAAGVKHGRSVMQFFALTALIEAARLIRQYPEAARVPFKRPCERRP